ncbi:MAG: bifunctional 5,10-methylenetetrahydrofolate dehydrogenase/5,10-methenyltetrahydrofolate cyclohydrolase [Candidatus Omnitrophota bacterium]|nr:bifunctional 5,10-methylenetetrahydrofolate dehydrogenase/5,10-methenyltetrahydrofolate cyclohydrolase [Candidatus Omnitrophota bacterium]
MAKIIDGKKIAAEINESVKKRIKEISAAVGRVPKLASLTLGSPKDAEIYVNMQKRTAEKVGIDFEDIRLEADLSQEDLIREIEKLNKDIFVTAIIVQKPVPENIDHDRIIAAIDPRKDAEGLHPYNLGKILRHEADLVACTPGAVMKILSAEKIDLYGKEVVIVGGSAVVGKPLSLLMLNEMATTTVCNIATSEKGYLSEHVGRADVLVVAVGCPEMIKGEWVSEGAVVIDVGINMVEDKIVGDVAFSEVEKKASVITPVPGGVGPVTVSILMRNVFRAHKAQHLSSTGL